MLTVDIHLIITLEMVILKDCVPMIRHVLGINKRFFAKGINKMDKNIAKSRLLGLYPTRQTGTWIIRGEDDNADLAGPHSTPRIAEYTGTYEEALDYALSLPRFITWGAGGSIEPNWTLSKAQNSIDQIHKLFEIVLAEAAQAEENAAFNGGMGDRDASRLRDQVKFYKYGMNCSIPSEWKSYEVQLDPEYEKYLELKKKFG